MRNQLEVIVKESGLETTKAKFILEKFSNYFEVASEWEIKAKQIIVTKPEQTAEMEMARAGRLFLREKRIAVENARKTLKEQALREGKAIDGIANVLKALIVPIEEYLEKQERFVEIQKEQKEAKMRAEIERRMEDERLAEEKAKAEALEKARIENDKLKAEIAKKEKEAAKEKAKKDAELEQLRKKAEEERARQEEKLAEERARSEKERRKAEEAMCMERERAEAIKKEADAKAKAKLEKEREKLEAEREEKARLAEILKNQVECPRCHHKFSLKQGGE